MAYSIASVEAQRGEVVIRIREWDGIDRPDYITLSGLSPAQAKGWAENLVSSAEQADSFLRQRSTEILEGKKKDLARLKKEVARLEKEVADA